MGHNSTIETRCHMSSEALKGCLHWQFSEQQSLFRCDFYTCPQLELSALHKQVMLVHIRKVALPGGTKKEAAHWSTLEPMYCPPSVARTQDTTVQGERHQSSIVLAMTAQKCNTGNIYRSSPSLSCQESLKR